VRPAVIRNPRARARTQENPMVNKVILVGNLVRDAEALTGSRGAVTRMRLATTQHWRDAEGNRQETSEYHNLVVFNRLAEICATYCLKGRRVYIEGRLRTREYVGADGVRRYATEVVVEIMRLLDRREAAAEMHGEESELLNAALHDDDRNAPAPDEPEPALSGAATQG
jgi:single-strand DNA-binding protein